ncbi:hypothetical protein BDV37DRAFT_281279 [Aspergillus pseudonomiae]|uniref:Uncharacterized protein n=1 Tax=Aspergillus pseudonomiae TaxID=1506151 RepID=A0A5N7DHZ2_9EURO|nr:uncharacterized protein BDV37DRAFT_281279 [Aspergillus pseudonomiae]KAE8406037.1 hypothetical protein BDV37DRAFT_281279 [Aspergillus pseudonomiae]
MAKDVQSLKVKAKPTRAKADERVAALLKARKPDRYHYDKEVFESLVGQMSRCFSHAAPNQGQPAADLITGRAVKLKDRCGIPPEQTQQLDRPYLFVDQLHAELLLQQKVSSLYVRQSVYYAFFGKLSTPRQPRATAGSGPSEHASDRSSPLFMPDDSAHLQSRSVVDNRLQHSDLAEHLEDRRQEQETHRERRRQRREERWYRRRERRHHRERATQYMLIPPRAPPSRQASTITESNEVLLINGGSQGDQLSDDELRVETGLNAPRLEDRIEETSIEMIDQDLVQHGAEEITENERLENGAPIEEGHRECHHDDLPNRVISDRSYKDITDPAQSQDEQGHAAENKQRQGEQVARDCAMALDQLQNGAANLPLTPEYNDRTVEPARPVTPLDIIITRWRERGSQLGEENSKGLTSPGLRNGTLETVAADHLEWGFGDSVSGSEQETEKVLDAPATQVTREAAGQPGAEQIQKEQDDRVAAEQALFDEDVHLTEEEAEIQRSESAPNNRKRVAPARKAHKRLHDGIIVLGDEAQKTFTQLESTACTEGTPATESYQRKRPRLQDVTIRFLAYESRGDWRTLETVTVNVSALGDAQRIANRYARLHDLNARFYNRSLRKVSVNHCVRAMIDDDSLTIFMSLGRDLKVTRLLVASVARMLSVKQSTARDDILNKRQA